VTSAQLGGVWHSVAFGHPKDSSNTSFAGRTPLRETEVSCQLRRLWAASSIIWLSADSPETFTPADSADMASSQQPADAVAGPSSSQTRWQ
jgi:hypothetical protein